MKIKRYVIFSGTIFAIVGILHLLRVVFQLNFIIGSYSVPMWMNVVAVIVLTFLSITAFSIVKNTKGR